MIACVMEDTRYNLTEFNSEKFVDSMGRKRYRVPREQARRFGLKRYYGMTWETYNVMLAAQNGVCDICKGTETYQPKTYQGPKALSVDHNHKNGQIRGLLCSNCNYLIGHCKEDADILMAAAKYLEKHAAVAQSEPQVVITDTSEELH